MALPNVKVNVGEETISTSNTLIPFVPVVIMKTNIKINPLKQPNSPKIKK